ncbi:MAG TPA: sigma-70 family RNA polymerase sigma factor [Pyrinomonadaceae bacterium]|nr:sigma-70 family RNA polymerase sigma factor [Pyrinomonadaceae bacterium]
MENVTGLLIAWSNGDESAYEKLAPLVHAELHRLAHRYMSRERDGHTLQTTALVNEAYLRLVDQKQTRWQNRAQFFGICAELMRRILVDYARQQKYQKRGGGARKISLDEAAELSEEKTTDLILLDDALKELAAFDPRKARVVELRFFGGLSNDEVAEVMGVHANTVSRDWNAAKAWLYKEVTSKK